jgi:hypothetical protein
MLELILPVGAVVWNDPTVTVYFTSEAVVKGLHIAHLKDVKISKALIGGNYNISLIGPSGNVMIPVDAAQISEAEAFVTELTGVITRYRAGKR